MYNPYDNNNQKENINAPDNINNPVTPTNEVMPSETAQINTNPTETQQSFTDTTQTAYQNTTNQYATNQNNINPNFNQNAQQQGYQAPPPYQATYPNQNLNQPNNNVQSSYTWGANAYNQYPQKPPVYAPLPPKAPKKKKPSNHSIFKRIAALVLCCVISSMVTIGAFTALIQTGVISIENSSTDSTAAFTITKIVDNTSTQTSDEGVLTTQEIAEKVLPSVVCIQNYQSTTTQSFFGGQSSESEITLAGEGSGVIMSEDGYIITNAHVVEDAAALTVITEDGTTYEAVLIGSDEVTDLAVIKIEATGLVAAEFGSSDDLVVGDMVVAICNPGGMTFSSTVTVGYVSALDREIESGDSGYIMSVIQTDAAINPGNSGGALINEYGQVIGITSSKYVSEGYEGLAFAIPIDDAQTIVTDLQNYGEVQNRAVLGISGQYVDSYTASFYGLSTGMFVQELLTDEATASELQVYDVITAINGTDVTSSALITSLLAMLSPGDEVTLTVDRAMTGETDLEITIVLSTYSDS